MKEIDDFEVRLIQSKEGISHRNYSGLKHGINKMISDNLKNGGKDKSAFKRAILMFKDAHVMMKGKQKIRVSKF